MPNNYLTKSRFKVGIDCATKLNYLDDKTYGNTNSDNSFLKALAEGGFQVGELAKIYHPGGTEITTNNKEQAFAETCELLKQTNAVIYEASIKFENLFVKIDVLVKKGDFVELIEVKAKSFDPTDEEKFYSKSSLKKKAPQVSSDWHPYLMDVAFQTYVLQKAFPKFKISSALMLANKKARASVSGINQKFFLERQANGQTKVITSPNAFEKDLGEKLLVKVSVDDEIKTLYAAPADDGKSFEQTVAHLSKICSEGAFEKPVVGSKCKSCEFRIGSDLKKSGLKSGFENCWSKGAGFKSEDFLKPMIFDIWNFRKTPKLLEDSIYFIDQLQEEDIAPTPKEGEPGLSVSERQWVQIQKSQKKDETPYFDHRGLAREMKSWNFPLHFIDFETTMVAIPFHRGRKPYEQIAFQFSHHTVDQTGKIRHQDEYINRIKGHFPNFDFVRALMQALNKDKGTIFRFATHENTVLCQIKNQLLDSSEPPGDRDQLIQFIDSITASGKEAAVKWEGARNMVDMCELVKKYFYHPLTKGSNSIKKVLPAILNESKFLQTKYAKPVYGAKDQVFSLNFKDWSWIEKDPQGVVVDPYKRLEPIFTDLDLDEMDSLITEGHIADGGAAMTSYARMQFTEMSEAECDRVAKALLRYCELDTFAMVMIYEYWKHEIETAARKAA